MVLRDKGLCQCQAEAGTAFTSGHQRIENTLPDARWNTGAIIDDLQMDADTVALSGQGDLPLCTCAKSDAGVFGLVLHHRLHGIAGDIQHCLDQFFTVTDQFGQAGVVITNHTNMVGGFCQQQATHPF